MEIAKSLKSSRGSGNGKKCKTYIGVQRFVGDAKQTLEIRVERRRNRQGGGCLHFSCTYTIILQKSSHVR